MLQWLFAAVESNAERAKTYPDYKVAAPDGFFMNLAAVCIKLCQPFIQPSAKTWARIDAGCELLFAMPLCHTAACSS
jgi:Ubiquitin elongating factor core